jgi:hypothetical protein
MTKDKGDVMLGTEVRQPVPAEDAFNPHDEVIEVGKDQLKEQFRVGIDVLMNFDLAPVADNADEHFSGVQIDPAVMFVLLCVESHDVASFG